MKYCCFVIAYGHDLIVWKYIYNEHVYDVYNYEYEALTYFKNNEGLTYFKYNEGVIVYE